MSFTDLTDSLAGGGFRYGKAVEKSGFVIQFYHIATFKKALDTKTNNGSQSTFKAFLTSFKDNFKVNWNSKETFGRMDPIQTFKNTQRQISISFDVPSHSEEEASANFIELQKLIMMQYPVYESVSYSQGAKPDTSTVSGDATDNTDPDTKKQLESAAAAAITQSTNGNSGFGRFMSSPPLLYIKFKNWISEDVTAATIDRVEYAGDALVGILSEVSFNPDLEQGFHFIEGKLVPKLFTLDLNISVIHTQELGWTRSIQGTTDELETHLFGQPVADPSSGGFQTYGAFPYQTDSYYYIKKE